MSAIDHKDRVDAIQVLGLSDDEAAAWLEKHAYSEENIFYSSPEQNLHKIASFAFARRPSNRTRLDVGRYGSHVTTLKRLFRNGTNAERLAVLSNPFIGPQREGRLLSSSCILTEAEAVDILRNYEVRGREFATFVSNPAIDREWLAAIVKGWSEIDELDRDGLIFLVHHLVNNPSISARRDDTFMDGFAEFSYGRLNFALADLLQSAPVTLAWADVLSRLLDKLHLPYTPDFDIELVEKWKDPEPREDGERFHFTILREQITRHLIIRDHREDAKKKYTIDHEDPAVRKGLYSALSPYQLFKDIHRGRDFCYPSFKYLDEFELSENQQQFVDFCKACFGRDKNDFVEALIRNDNFWKTKEDRAFLNDIAWNLAEDPHSMMDVPNTYRASEQYQLQNHPDYFKDDEMVEIPFEDTVEGKLARLESELEKLREELASQSLDDLVEQQRRHFENIIEDTQYQIRQLSEDLGTKTEALARTISQGSLAEQFRALESRLKRHGGLIWLLIIVLVAIWLLDTS